MEQGRYSMDNLIELLTNRLEERQQIKMYTIDEVAELLGLTKRTIYKYVTEKTLPAYKFGSAWRVGHDDLVQFIEDRKVK